MMDEQIHEHLMRLGIDRWTALRKHVEEARDGAKVRGHREAVTAFEFVLRTMDDCARFEEVATEIKRAELTGDVDGMLRAMSRL
jgi:hypothetical protein